MLLLEWHETLCHIPLLSDNVSSSVQLFFLGAVAAFGSTFCWFEWFFLAGGGGADLIRCGSSGNTL